MIASAKPPENYVLCWSRDPAIVVPDGDDERVEALRVARETQEWGPLTAPGQRPTRFTFRWLPELVYRRWWDLRRQSGGDMGLEEALALLLLAALVDVEGLGDGARLARVEDDRLRDRIADPAVLDRIRAAVGREATTHLVTELGLAVFSQEETTAGKS